MNKSKIMAFKGTKRQMLTAVEFVGYPGKGTDQEWMFLCDCGGIKKKRKQNFLNCNTNNCGCRHGLTKHGLSMKESHGKNLIKRHPAYSSWVNMRQRCNNPNNPDYRYYGGRGISHTERWNDFGNFLEDMGEPPSGYTLDRIDNDGDYTPENCRWASRYQQVQNRKTNPKVTYLGKTQTISDWRKELSLPFSYALLHRRIFTRGWDAERAFTQPVQRK